MPIIIANTAMCLSLSSVLLGAYHCLQCYCIPNLIINFTMSLSLSIYYMPMIIISFTMSLISPILLCAYLYRQFYCVYYYHQFYYVHIIITNSEVPIINNNFTMSLKLSPISLCVYQHQFYHVYIIITNFAISLPSSS